MNFNSLLSIGLEIAYFFNVSIGIAKVILRCFVIGFILFGLGLLKEKKHDFDVQGGL